MSKCLTSFTSYIQSRTKKITDFISRLSSSSLPSYTLVHTNYSNNIGILFQLLPKIHYLKPMTEHQSIVTIDEYAEHTISPEELRCIDYIINMKRQRHTGTVHQSSAPLFGLPNSITVGLGSISPFPEPFQVLHSLPIVYPYDDSN